MNNQRLIFGIITCFAMCGNVFALSPYAQTIQQNIHKKSFLSATSFPTTVADASFVARMENKREDYLPYFNRSAFQNLSLDEQDELERMARRAERDRINFRDTHARPEYCENYPMAPDCPGGMISIPQPNQPQPVDESAHPTPSVSTEPVQPQISVTPTPQTPPQVLPNNNVPFMRAAITPDNIAKYNLKTHNGGCTPPERSTRWRNNIQTSGHYQNSNPAFEKFMITAFRKEGDCVNDPNNRGGYTCFGCASEGLCHGIDMRNITRARVEDLAFQKIYKANHVDKLPDAFRGYAMWGLWGSGNKTGIKLFQRALGVPITYKIDNTTIRAAEQYTGDFAYAYTTTHEQFYRDIVKADPSQNRFLRGWLNSLELLRPSGCHVVPTNQIYR